MEFQHANLDYLWEMSGGNTKVIKEMIDIYTSEIPRYIERMHQYLESGNLEALGRLAHKAKASALIMGAGQIAENLRQLEKLAGEGHHHISYREYVETITGQFELSVGELKKFAESLQDRPE